MIVARFGQIAPETGHDHGVAPLGAFALGLLLGHARGSAG